MTEEEISVAEAARRLGVTLAHIYSLLWAGRLTGRKLNGRWLVSEQAVESRQKARANHG